MADFDMVPLRSTNVAAAGYDDATREMRVEFIGGAVYGYQGVPREVYDGLVSAPSPGAYLHRQVKDVYRSAKIGG